MILKVNANKSESENKTLSEGEEGSESSGSNSGLGSLENSREDSGGTGKSNHQVSFSPMSDCEKDENGCCCWWDISISKHVLNKLSLGPIGPQ